MSSVQGYVPLAFPQFAPLPTAFFLQLLREDEGSTRQLLQRPTVPFSKRWQEVSLLFPEKREEMLTMMHPVIDSDELTVAWFQRAITSVLERKRSLAASHNLSYQERPLFSRQSIKRWRDGNILGQGLDPTRMLAILIAAGIDSRERDFVPSFFSSEEPTYYCYTKVSPTAPITASSIPIGNGPRGSLYYTPFQAPYWTDPCWWSSPSVTESGCFRWGGAMWENGAIRWTLTLEDLDPWLRSMVVPSSWKLLFDARSLKMDDLHMLAQTVLLHEALTWMKASASLSYTPPYIHPGFVPLAL